MADGILSQYPEQFYVRSAGTHPSEKPNPKAVQVLKEIDIDISNNTSDNVDLYLDEKWDYVLTVCDSAKETCPVFLGEVKNIIHHSFYDPSETDKTGEEELNEYRKIRDAISEYLHKEFIK
jgi:arsenate reductase